MMDTVAAHSSPEKIRPHRTYKARNRNALFGAHDRYNDFAGERPRAHRSFDEGVEIHNELIMLRRDAQKALRRRFARAKREGDLPKHSNPDSLARFITTAPTG